jgi:putative ABC transport system ATP-binding protein
MVTQIHVALHGLARRYRSHGRDTIVLAGVTASFLRGEFVVVLGRSGSGKSTLLNLIAGLDIPSNGEVLISGQSLFALSEPQRTLLRRRHIGFVFQAYNLIPTLNVMENLLLPLELNGLRGTGANETAIKWLDAVGLIGYERALPEELSGGEQQRVAIARSLVHDPALILADEPTGNLDLETAHHVMRLLDELCRQRGKTLIVATHSREVMGLADRVVSIRGGQIVEEVA